MKKKRLGGHTADSVSKNVQIQKNQKVEIFGLSNKFGVKKSTISILVATKTREEARWRTTQAQRSKITQQRKSRQNGHLFKVIT